MTVLRVEVTAEHIAAAGLAPGPDAVTETVEHDPVELAIAEVTGQPTMCDSDIDPVGELATIGQGGTVLVVGLPLAVHEWINAWYGGEPVEPFAFDITIEPWLVGLIRGLVDLVTLTEAAAALELEPQTLRHAANALRDGDASPDALAGRLGIRRIGRDWLVPRDRLEREVARRQGAPA